MQNNVNFKKVRIFCATPSDIFQEREILNKIVQELNKSISDVFNIQFEVLDPYDIAPSMGRPQSIVFKHLPIETWDLFIGILWCRFGSPTGTESQDSTEYFSGTEEEFYQALGSFKKTGKPDIFFYRSKKDINPDTIDIDQFKKVQNFFKEFEGNGNHPAYVQSYRTENEFEKKIRENLISFLKNNFSNNEEKNDWENYNKNEGSDSLIQETYLTNLINFCNIVPLIAINEEHDVSSKFIPKLEQVYIDLLAPEKNEKSTTDISEEKTINIIDAVQKYNTLIIYGDPGGGKTSSINKIIIDLAKYNLTNKSNLKNWSLGQLLPIKFTLSIFAQFVEKKISEINLIDSNEVRQLELSKLPLKFITYNYIDNKSEKIQSFINSQINAGKCLIVFDGWDELGARSVPLIKEILTFFYTAYSENRFIITCRTNSALKKAIPSFFNAELTLRPLDKNQINKFIRQWYKLLVSNYNWDSEKSHEGSYNLIDSISKHQSLLEMAKTPFLLTAMIIIHINNVELPNQKVKLYKKLSNLLLRRWQEFKSKKPLTILSELDNISLIYYSIWEIAYLATKNNVNVESSNISEQDIIKVLKKSFSKSLDPLGSATRLLSLIDQTAGLLIKKGTANGDMYAFPHKTFQEYFTGCYILKLAEEGFQNKIKSLIKEGTYWYAIAEIGFQELIYNDKNENQAKDIIYLIISDIEETDKDEYHLRSCLWAAKFTAILGKEKIALDKFNNGETKLKLMINKLLLIIGTEILSMEEKIDAGFALNILGDIREGVTNFPPTWVSFNSCIFEMGCPEFGPIHKVNLSAYQISKFPITNAQYNLFLQEENYYNWAWWSEEGLDFILKNKSRLRISSTNEDFSFFNQPVVDVTWYEAEAFCKWLSNLLLGNNSEYLIRLPTEAEWENAVKGTVNRYFPWGNEHDIPTFEHANFNNNVKKPTPVGIYSKGLTSEGIYDLAGNVWEWCLDWYDSEYYKKCLDEGSIENPKGSINGNYKVVRGGAWNQPGSYIKATCRLKANPNLPHFNGGFRIVLVKK